MKISELVHGLSTVIEGRDRQIAAGLLVLIILSSLLETAGIASIGPFLAVLSAPAAIEKSWSISLLYHALGAHDVRTFQIYLGLITAATVVVGNAIGALTVWLIFRFTFRQDFKLGCRLLGTYLAQPYTYFLQHNTVELARNIYDEVPRAISAVVLPMFHVVSKTISVMFIVALLIYFDKTIAFFVIIVFGGSYYLLYKALQRRSHSVREVVLEMRGAELRLAAEALSGIKELKVLGGEARCVEMYAVPASMVADADARHQILTTVPKYLLETVAFVGLVLVVIFLLLRGDAEFTALPLLAVYAFAGYRLMPALQHLYTNLHYIQYYLPSLQSVVSALELGKHVPPLEAAREPVKPLPLKEVVEFDNVVFRYPSAQAAVLDDISLRIEANTVTGVVGTTGSGKSTLLDVFLGLLEPTTGDVRVDGVALDASKARSWQASIGYVPQQMFLTDGTIAENIALGQFGADIDMDRLAMAGKAAHVDDFVAELSDGYASKIGERGIRLSGGQRQRIGIARALYRNPAVLVFDEATSALDNITETAIMDTLRGLMGEKTIVLVAHRLTTLRLCDQIILLEGGRITQRGTYEELLERSEFFRESHNAGRMPAEATSPQTGLA